MRAIEFYTTPSGEVTIKEQGQPERQLKESDTDFIQSFLEILEEFYPEAYAALRKYYARYVSGAMRSPSRATRSPMAFSANEIRGTDLLS